MDRVHRAERPVAGEQRLLVLLRKRRAVAEGNADRRPGADVDERRQAVGKRGRPLAAAAPPAQVAAAGRMVDPRGAVPGSAEIPLHVGVVQEEFAVGIEGHVVGVAIPGRPDFPRPAVGIGARHVTAGGEQANGMPVGVPHPRNDLILIPVRRQPAGAIGRELHPPLISTDAPHRQRLGDVGDRERQLGVVAAEHEQPLAVGRQQHGVRAMLARTLETAELLDRIGHVVTVGIRHPVEAAAGTAIADDVERIKRPEQSLGRRERHGNPLDDRGPGAVDRGGGNADESFVALIARDQPALGIGGQADPRTEFVSRDGEYPLDHEALRHGKRRGIVGGRSRSRAVGHGDDRLLPPGHGGRRVRRS